MAKISVTTKSYDMDKNRGIYNRQVVLNWQDAYWAVMSSRGLKIDEIEIQSSEGDFRFTIKPEEMRYDEPIINTKLKFKQVFDIQFTFWERIENLFVGESIEYRPEGGI